METYDCTKALRDKYGKMLLSKSETAHEVGVSEATIDRLRKQGDITSKKVGGQVMFNIGTVAEFITA